MTRSASPTAQRGITMLVVLMLLSVMLLGGLALARLSQVGTLATGNAAFHEAAVQASEVGLNTAFAAVRGLNGDDDAVAGWYWATPQTKDANGLPVIDWSTAPEVTVGTMSVRYVAERACTVTPVTDPLTQCLVRQSPADVVSASAGNEEIPPMSSKQFRITVRVTGPKGTQTFVQSLVTKG